MGFQVVAGPILPSPRGSGLPFEAVHGGSRDVATEFHVLGRRDGPAATKAGSAWQSQGRQMGREEGASTQATDGWGDNTLLFLF